MSMDLTIKTKRFDVLCCDKTIPTIYIANKFNKVPDFDSHFYLTKKEMKEIIDAFDVTSCSKCEKLLRHQLVAIEKFMEDNEKADFHFW